MGSSVFDPTSIALAAACALLYLACDAARHFLHHVSPMKLRQWSGTDPQFRRGSRWFQYDKQHFSLISGVFVQGALVAGVAFTVIALLRYGRLVAVIAAVATWAILVVGWKVVLAMVPDERAETIFRGLIPLSHALYYLFIPALFPMRLLLQSIDAREEEDDDEPTDEEVQAYIDVGEEEGILDGSEGRLVQQIVEFGDRIVREVMTPRVEIDAIRVDASLDELGRLFSESKYSRIPVYTQTIDNIVGVVHIKDFFDVFLRKQEKTVREIARPAYFVSETKKVSELLRELQIEHLQIAIAVDEYGGTAGLISIEDLLEEIVGEIADEHEDAEEALFVEIDDGIYLVSGMMKVEELDGLLDTHLDSEDHDFETVAGLIFKRLGRIPKVGETVITDGLSLRVDRADRKRIYRVVVERTALAEPGREKD